MLFVSFEGYISWMIETRIRILVSLFRYLLAILVTYSSIFFCQSKQDYKCNFHVQLYIAHLSTIHNCAENTFLCFVLLFGEIN